MPVELVFDECVIACACVAYSVGVEYTCLVDGYFRVEFGFDVVEDIDVGFAVFFHEFEVVVHCVCALEDFFDFDECDGVVHVIFLIIFYY